MRKEQWEPYAKCKGIDINVFVPDYYQGIVKRKKDKLEQQAKQICHECPVRLACLEYALVYDLVGIWGGMNETERRNWARSRKLSDFTESSKHHPNIGSKDI